MHAKRWTAALLCCLVLFSGCAANDASNDALRAIPETESSSTEPAPTAPESTETPETEAPETTEVQETTVAPETTEAPVDTEAPFFVYLASVAELERGKEFNIHKYISYIDDLDAEVELSVEGEVDPETEGEYPLALTLRDDAGNAASADLTVKVVPPGSTAVSYTPLPSKSFAEFAATYEKDGAMVGIDVSKWQGYIDFQKVAAAGCAFVIIRIGGYAIERFEDPYFAYNLQSAKAAGLKVGVYWYSEENSAQKVRENAAFLYDLLDGAALDFPIFFDWEDYADMEDYRMSLRDLNEMFLAFREEAEARGYRAALYNSRNMLDVLWTDEVKGDGVWLAHYIGETNYDGKYFLWQQGLGRIEGISGDVDVDVFYPDAMPE